MSVYVCVCKIQENLQTCLRTLRESHLQVAGIYVVVRLFRIHIFLFALGTLWHLQSENSGCSRTLWTDWPGVSARTNEKEQIRTFKTNDWQQLKTLKIYCWKKLQQLERATQSKLERLERTIEKKYRTFTTSNWEHIRTLRTNHWEQVRTLRTNHWEQIRTLRMSTPLS